MTITARVLVPVRKFVSDELAGRAQRLAAEQAERGSGDRMVNVCGLGHGIEP